MATLPWMESFFGGQLLSAKETVSAPPARFLTLFFPNGVYPKYWTAKEDGGKLVLEDALAPLSRFADNAVVVEGLNNPLSGAPRPDERLSQWGWIRAERSWNHRGRHLA